MTIEAVVFDIGNVLIEWQPERYYDRRIGREGRRKMFSQVDLHAMMTRIDSGGDFGFEVAATAAAHPGWEREILWVRDRWREIAQPEIPRSVRLLKALKARGMPVFALTNFGARNFPLSVAQFPFLNLFDRRYVSGEMGLIKPDPSIYTAVEADCGIAPCRLLFADDRPENIATAVRRGWQTHLFDGPAGWAHCLVRHGLLSEKEAA